MKELDWKPLVAVFGAVLVVTITVIVLPPSDGSQEPADSAIQSQYAGQEVRGIKALSQDDVDGLLAGAGTPFGGMAKPAELNGYPGPRHVLDAVAAGEFDLEQGQLGEIETLYDAMNSEAVALGKQIIDLEQAIDDAFSNGAMTDEFLEEKVSASADFYGQLRVVHLGYHLSMVSILTPEQVEQYNELRGYSSSDDPCENVPEGHDEEQWRQHNNC